PPTRSIASTGAPASRAATSKTSCSAWLSANKQRLLDRRPVPADGVGKSLGTGAVGQQDAANLRWKCGVVEHLLQVVDEHVAAELADAGELLVARRQEVDVLPANAESGGCEEVP